jgi:hypothetical protein
MPVWRVNSLAASSHHGPSVLQMAFTDAVWACKVADPSVKRMQDAIVLKV